MSHATDRYVAQSPPPAASEDLTVQQSKSKSNTLNSQRNGNTLGYGYSVGGGGSGGGGSSSSSSRPEKLTVLDMTLESLGLRNLTSKDIGVLISERGNNIMLILRALINPLS